MESAGAAGFCVSSLEEALELRDGGVEAQSMPKLEGGAFGGGTWAFASEPNRVVSTTNLDVAVSAGAKLIIVVNPLVPYHNDFVQRVSTLLGSRRLRSMPSSSAKRAPRRKLPPPTTSTS